MTQLMRLNKQTTTNKRQTPQTNDKQMKNKKYHATRNLSNGSFESMEFDRKTEAVQWVKKHGSHGRVRIQDETRKVVFSRGF